MSRAVLTTVLVLVWGLASGPAAVRAAPPDELVGRWITTEGPGTVVTEYGRDGSYLCEIRTGTAVKTLRGTYQTNGSRLEVRLGEPAQVLARTWRVLEGRTLELTDDEGNRSALSRDASPVTTASAAAQAPARGRALVLRRMPEPRQKAFTVLVPEGWLLEGGLFAVDPTASGGALNAVDTKCDLSIKRDPAGSVMIRWAPAYSFADFSRSAEFAITAGMFGPGTVYNGALVRPMPTVQQFLLDAFKQAHPQASSPEVVLTVALPQAQQLCEAMMRDVNLKMVQLGKSPMTFSAGAVVIEYDESGTRYRHALVTTLWDWRATAAIWSNQFTFELRAPAAEADDQKPLLDVIRQSLEIDPGWLAAYIQASGERGATVAEVFRHLASVDREIFERRSATRSETMESNYLVLTGQEDYVNPYTRKVERDTSTYPYRWTNPNGDRLYTSEQTFDPNRDELLNRIEWKLTPVRPR